MKTTIALIALFSSISFADSIHLECRPLTPPKIQGEERFAKIDFPSQTEATLKIADMTSPFEDIAPGLVFKRASYSDTATSAMAVWVDEKGSEVVSLHLMYMGSWWGGIVFFHQAHQTPSLVYPSGQELQLRCD